MSRPLPTARRPRPRPPPPPAPADRFRAMLRRREAELSVELRDYGDGDGDGDDPPPPLPAAEVVAIFEEVLSDLTFNSKPMIGDLTAIAAEQRACARGIAAAVCDRILKVPVDHKLPSLYLLDSIVKTVGREYVIHFAAYLPKVFCETYNQVDPSLYSAMHHLLKTWSKVFHPSVLRNIEDELKFCAPLNQRSTGLADMGYSESPSPGPSHGIHVNPKYLEARHQFEHSDARRLVGSSSGEDTLNIEGDRVETLERNTSESPERWSGASPQFHDVRHMKGAASSLQVYGQKSCVQFGDYDFDPFESLSSGREDLRASSPQTAAMRTSPMVGLERALPCLKRRRSRSPPRIGLRRSESPVVDRFGQGGGVDRASPSHSGHGFGHDRGHDQNGWIDKRCPSENSAQPRESSTGYHRNNRYAKQRSRDLIDAYGNHRETSHFNEKRPKVQQLDVIGNNSNTNTRNWQSSEEEEYIWEDMSPTLASHSNRKFVQPFRPLNEKPGSNRPGDMIFNSDSRRSDWEDQASLQSLVDEDKIVDLHYGQRTMDKYLDGAESQNEELLEYKSSHHLQESRNPYSFLHNAQKIRNPNSQTRGPQFPYSVSGTKPSIGQKRPAPYDNLPDAEAPFRRLSGIDSGSSNMYIPAMKKHGQERLYSPPHSTPAIRSPVQKSQPLPFVAIHPNQKKNNIRCEPIEGNKPEINRGSNSSLVLPWQQYDAADKNPTLLKEPFQSSYQGPGSIHVRPQKSEPSSRSQSQDAHGSFFPPTQSRGSTYLVSQPLRHMPTQGQDVVKCSNFSNSLLDAPSSAGMLSMSDTVFHVHGGVLPPLPPGSHPSRSQTGPASQNISSIISSDLFTNLMAQGLISLKPPVQSEGSIGLEFNAELLKARHEPTVNALYIDLSRQCTTCGLRFRCQEEHSSHMDWHVTKNRISRNRKQKPSRNWFVSVKEWLSGAEVLGTDVAAGFLPTETVTENKSDKQMTVRADENQNTCALCGELFEDFYSDETEEWMYKHAVYLNAPHGNIEGLDSSQWGPIVHEKCRPEFVEDTGIS